MALATRAPLIPLTTRRPPLPLTLPPSGGGWQPQAIAAGNRLATSLISRLERHLTFSQRIGRDQHRLLMSLPALSFLLRRRPLPTVTATAGQPPRWPIARVVTPVAGAQPWDEVTAPAEEAIDWGVAATLAEATSTADPTDRGAPLTLAPRAGVPAATTPPAPVVSDPGGLAADQRPVDVVAGPPLMHEVDAGSGTPGLDDPAARLAGSILARHTADWTVLVGEAASDEATGATDADTDVPAAETWTEAEPWWWASGEPIETAAADATLASSLGPAGRAPWPATRPTLARLARRHLDPPTGPAARPALPLVAMTTLTDTVAAAPVTSVPPVARGAAEPGAITPLPTAAEAPDAGVYAGAAALVGGDALGSSEQPATGAPWPSLARLTEAVAPGLAATAGFIAALARSPARDAVAGSRADDGAGGGVLPGAAGPPGASRPTGVAGQPLLSLVLQRPLDPRYPGRLTGSPGDESPTPGSTPVLPLPLSPATPSPGLASATLPAPRADWGSSVLAPAVVPATLTPETSVADEGAEVVPSLTEAGLGLDAPSDSATAALQLPIGARASLAPVRAAPELARPPAPWTMLDRTAASHGARDPFVSPASTTTGDGGEPVVTPAAAQIRTGTAAMRRQERGLATPWPVAAPALLGALAPSVVARVTDLLRSRPMAVDSAGVTLGRDMAMSGQLRDEGIATLGTEPAHVAATGGGLTSLRPPLSLTLQRQSGAGQPVPYGIGSALAADTTADDVEVADRQSATPVAATSDVEPWRALPDLAAPVTASGAEVAAGVTTAPLVWLTEPTISPALIPWQPAGLTATLARTWSVPAQATIDRPDAADHPHRPPAPAGAAPLAAIRRDRLAAPPPTAGAMDSAPILPAARAGVDLSAGDLAHAPAPAAMPWLPSVFDVAATGAEAVLARSLWPIIARATGPQRAAAQHMTASSGAPLHAPLRERFERLLHAPLGDVDIHSDAAAGEATAALGAAAVTVGPRIFFAPGRFQPEAPASDALLAHELVHVIQQRTGPARMALKRLDGGHTSDDLADEPAAEAAESGVLALHQAGAFAPHALPLARLPATGPASPNGGSESYTHFDLTGPALGTEAAPAIARITSTTYEGDSSSIERAEGGTAPAGPAEGQTRPGEGPDVRKLAQSVYEIIKDDLAAERERRGRWL
ncbi:MAG: DUF4157 domain-containing protein [Chloroflexi bacterium]|nr:DUF4157 domain-containing protein [Chloroflexota bacterium]